jgi:hypothetical protein
LQNFVVMLLLDDPRLANVPVVPEWKFHMESDQIIDILWTAPRTTFNVTPTGPIVLPDGSGGNNAASQAPPLVGAGMLVEMPTIVSDSPGVSGPPRVWQLSVVSFEERNTNFLPGTGTCVTSEQYAQLVADILHLQFTFTYGTVQAKRDLVSPAHDWMNLKPGIFAYRTLFQATVGIPQTQRTAPALVSFAGGNCTVTCSDSGAAAYYTTDGSCPCGANVNPFNPAGVGATLYTTPFAVASGTLVLAAARNSAAGKTLSPVNGATAP